MRTELSLPNVEKTIGAVAGTIHCVVSVDLKYMFAFICSYL